MWAWIMWSLRAHVLPREAHAKRHALRGETRAVHGQRGGGRDGGCPCGRPRHRGGRPSWPARWRATGLLDALVPPRLLPLSRGARAALRDGHRAEGDVDVAQDGHRARVLAARLPPSTREVGGGQAAAGQPTPPPAAHAWSVQRAGDPTPLRAHRGGAARREQARGALTRSVSWSAQYVTVYVRPDTSPNLPTSPHAASAAHATGALAHWQARCAHAMSWPSMVMAVVVVGMLSSPRRGCSPYPRRSPASPSQTGWSRTCAAQRSAGLVPMQSKVAAARLPRRGHREEWDAGEVRRRSAHITQHEALAHGRACTRAWWRRRSRCKAAQKATKLRSDLVVPGGVQGRDPRLKAR